MDRALVWRGTHDQPLPQPTFARRRRETVNGDGWKTLLVVLVAIPFLEDEPRRLSTTVTKAERSPCEFEAANRDRLNMKILVVGGAGLIGRTLIPRLAREGHEVTCFDINTNVPDLGAAFVRGDVTQFDDVVGAVATARPDRLINLSYHIGSDLAPHIATKLNIVGMDNCFEAARLFDVRHTIYASSLAVSGLQSHFGDRKSTETDGKFGNNQYAMHKIFNEWQAHDYHEKYGMVITGIRPANVTGPDKVRGSIDHVNCITQPARGRQVTFPFRDAMRIPIHVDDIAEVFARVSVVDRPAHALYNSGGTPLSMGELAGLVAEFLPQADIRFEKDAGGLAKSANFLIDNTRLVEEFGVQYVPFRSRVLQIINDIRRSEGLPLATDPAAR